MQQTLHIFRKDLRFLWAPILAVLALTALAAWSLSVDPARLGRGNARADTIPTLIYVIQLLSWVSLVAAAIYKEPPAGDRQFWITRPYRWSSLVGAKALLIVACINVPYLISDVAILSAHGLSPSFGALVGRQAVITGLFLLPTAALAAVTRHSAQIGMTIFAVLLLLTITANFRHYSGVPLGARDILILAVLGGTALCVMIWQYALRRTALARGLLAAGSALCFAILMANPMVAANTLSWTESEPAEVRPVHLCFATDMVPGSCPVWDGHEIADSFSVRIEGLPPGTSAEPEVLNLQIDGPNGPQWSFGWHPPTSVQPDGIGWLWAWIWSDQGLGRWLDVDIGDRLAERLRLRPVNLRLSVGMTIYRPIVTVGLPLDGSPRRIDGVGVCSLDSLGGLGLSKLLCRGTAAPSVRVAVNGGAIFGGASTSRGLFEPSPVFEISTELNTPASFAVQLTTEQPIAHIRRDLVMTQVQLKHIEAKP